MKRTIFTLIATSGVAIALVALFFLRGKMRQEIRVAGDRLCVTATEEKIVDGDSMHGVLESGTRIKILRGYYACNTVLRGDVVVFRYSAEAEPLIKIIKGIPGDRFAAKKNRDVWNVVVNDAILTTSSGEPYALNKAQAQLLSLYVRDYKGVIPKDAYLVFGNLAVDSFDSRNLGLIGKVDIIGKVMIP